MPRKDDRMKGFLEKARTAVVLFVVVALLAPFFAGQGVSAAAKKYTVGAFQVAAPASWNADTQTVGTNEQLMFQNGMYVLLVQSTYVGQTVDTNLLNSALKLGFESMSKSMGGVEIKGAKYSETKIKLGKAVKFTGKINANGISVKCRGYAVSKNGYIMLAMALGNQDKNEKKVINSIRLK